MHRDGFFCQQEGIMENEAVVFNRIVTIFQRTLFRPATAKDSFLSHSPHFEASTRTEQAKFNLDLFSQIKVDIPWKSIKRALFSMSAIQKGDSNDSCE